VTWRLPKVEETQYLNLYEQAEKDFKIIHSRECDRVCTEARYLLVGW